MQKQSEDEHTKIDDDWGNPPSPDTPANRKKAIKAQIIRCRRFNWYFTTRNHVLAKGN